MQEHEEPLHEVSFVPSFEEINVEYDAGTTFEVTMHDGSSLRLRKLERGYDPTDKIQAVSRLMESHAEGEVLTGVFYINAKAPSFIDMLNVSDQPLATLAESLTRPSREALAQCMAELQ
jgi:2-oxoglutarate ferredoxin oxidoreductase subunit beta